MAEGRRLVNRRDVHLIKFPIVCIEPRVCHLLSNYRDIIDTSEVTPRWARSGSHCDRFSMNMPPIINLN